jgi:tRNA(fMet)-specific endonuclease VapC
MIYMLDTNMCSYITRNSPKHVKEKLQKVEQEHIVALSTIVVSELLYGAYKKRIKKLIEVVETFIDCFKIYKFDVETAREYGKIRTDLEMQGEIIEAYDLQIAAHAKSLRAVLSTNNGREFKRIKNLQIENWLEEFPKAKEV